MPAGATKKECARCHDFKPPEAFGKGKQQKDGLSPYCRECSKEIGKARYAANPDYFKVYSHRCGKAYRESDRGRTSSNERTSRWAKANPEKRAETMRRWREKNTEKRRAHKKAWVEANRARVQEAVRRRYALKKKASYIPFTDEQLLQKIAYWGNACWICGAPWEHIDHVKPLGKGGAHILANLRPACRKCNQSKHAKWPIRRVAKT